MGLTDEERRRVVDEAGLVIVKQPLKGQNTYHTDPDCRHVAEIADPQVVERESLRLSIRQCGTCRGGPYSAPAVGGE